MAQKQVIEISSGTIFRILLILAGAFFLYSIRDIVLALLASILLASAIEPLANRFEKYNVPRGVTVIGTYVLMLAVLMLAVTLMIPPIAEQTTQLSHALPQLTLSLQDWVGQIPVESQQAVVSQVQSSLSQIGSALGNFGANIFQQTANLFTAIISLLFVLMSAFYIVVERNALVKFFGYIVPREHLRYVSHTVERSQEKIGKWVLGQLMLAVSIWLVATIGLWVLGVKYALALGLLAGLFEIVPVIGPILAAIPAVIVGLSQSLFLGLGVLVFYIVMQQVENNVLVPNIMKKVTGLPPLVILIAVLLGARIAGIPGVILAVPFATIIGIFLSDFFGGAKK